MVKLKLLVKNSNFLLVIGAAVAGFRGLRVGVLENNFCFGLSIAAHSSGTRGCALSNANDDLVVAEDDLELRVSVYDQDLL